MIPVDTDTLAVGFYLGILLMAATVVILTVIYITRPASEKTVFEGKFWRRLKKGKKLPDFEQHRVIQGQDLYPQENYAVSEQVAAGSPNPNQIKKIIKSVGRKSRLKMKIKFPLKQVKTTEKSQELPDKRVMDKDGPISGFSQIAADSNGPSAPRSVPAGLPAIAVSGNPASGTAIPESGRSGAPSSGQPEASGTGMAMKDFPPQVAETKVAEPAKPAAESSPAKPEASQPEPPPADKAAHKEPPGQKTNADDISGLFASEAVDDSETSKLAEGMNNVDVDNLLTDGLDLVKLLKRK